MSSKGRFLSKKLIGPGLLRIPLRYLHLNAIGSNSHLPKSFATFVDYSSVKVVSASELSLEFRLDGSGWILDD